MDIIHDDIVPVKSEREAEERFEEILRNYPKYGKNESTLNRYLGYHREMQRLMKQSSGRINMKRTITPSELNQRPAEFTVIDVRRKTDFDGKTILDAEWHNPDDVDQWAKDLPTDKEIVLYCARGGSVSNKVLDRLLATNIKARYIEGGIEAWKQSGGKVGQKEEKP